MKYIRHFENFDHEMDIRYGEFDDSNPVDIGKNIPKSIPSKNLINNKMSDFEDVKSEIKDLIKNDDLEGMKSLVSRIGVNYEDGLILRIAARNASVEIMKYLMEESNSTNPLLCFLAADYGNKDVLKYLITLGILNKEKCLKWIEHGRQLDADGKEDMKKFIKEI